MRAIVVRSFGGPEVLEVAHVALPEPGTGQVRIRVRAAGVNPVDAFVRSGLAARVGMLPRRSVTGLGWDVAGVVDAAGPGVARFTEGDEVIGLADRLDVPTAGYADYLVLDAAAVAPAPRGVSAELAATLPLNALTAAQALNLLDVPAGGTLLVTGAAGAVGGYAVELATSAGVRVVATAAAGDEALVRGFGAAEFVPREVVTDAGDGVTLGAAVRALVPGGVDAALDAAVVGTRALDAVRGDGAYAAVRADSAPPALRGIRVHTVFVRADGTRLAELSALVEAGKLTPRVAGRFPLEKVADAHRRFAEGGLRGRLVLLP